MFGLWPDDLNTMERDTINAAAHAKPVVVSLDKYTVPAPLIAVPEPPKAVAPPLPGKPLPSRAEELAEYAVVAAELGVDVPQLSVEGFLHFMERNDLPIYSLDEVRRYMDDKAEREGTGWGWCWKPIREKDRFVGNFGEHADFTMGSRFKATDSYRSHTQRGPSSLYSKTVPLHALKRMALIERAYKGTVHFLVCDYETQPIFRADPFLMAVIPNPQVGEGVGRFVIDFWDEPGFGIDKMLAK